MSGPLAGWSVAAVPSAELVPLELSYTVREGLTVGVEHVWPLALLPVAVAVFASLILRGGEDGRSASRRSRRLLFASRLAIAALLVVGAMVVPAVSAAYVQPTSDDNELVQYAQPQQEFRETFDDIGAIAPHNDGTDLLVYGSELVAEPGEGGGMPPECLRLARALPIHWYVAADDVETECAYDEEALNERIEEDQPAVIIAHVNRDGAVTAALQGEDEYERRQHHLRTMGREVVVFVNEDALAAAEQ